MTAPQPRPRSLPPLTLGKVGFGGAPLGNLFTAIDDEAAHAAVDAAWDSGIRYFDTAPHYGLGLSERRLGAALRDHPRDDYVLSTKVGRLLDPVPDVDPADIHAADDQGFEVPATVTRRWDFTADGVRRSIEESLERLGLSRIDIAYLHDPDDHVEQALDEAYPALEKLREEGVLRAIGVGMNQSAVPTRFVTETDIDVVLLAGRYTLLDQSASRDLLPAAEARGVAIVLGGVFNSGLLADPRNAATYDYAPAPPELIDRALEIEQICLEHGVPLRAAALQFGLAHPAVASALIGIRDAAQARDCAAMAGVPIPEMLWQSLRERGLIDRDNEV
ncbi:aldo/keto reductase [Actinospica sp. MGRD01-02]|uniref:Aldo/keto reductase n=1 Tax=Actinospica acidithermotolerans TaxID=2828514 RepID=A0A941E7D9_9ACTN|nr:aldo/keto reductase [Actinospica acidithermotolerans]MBR7826446.1 aldo/keto reductase [Actinospica acidithermotolerans]